MLHEGAIPLKTGNYDKRSVFEWWYRKTWYGEWENSITWSTTDWFNTYLHQYNDQFEIRNWPTELQAGDFFLMDLVGAEGGDTPPDGVPDHARFIIGEGTSTEDPAEYTCLKGANPVPTPVYGLLANQHCVDRANINWEFRIEGYSLWSIHVID